MPSWSKTAQCPTCVRRTDDKPFCTWPTAQSPTCVRRTDDKPFCTWQQHRVLPMSVELTINHSVPGQQHSVLPVSVELMINHSVPGQQHSVLPVSVELPQSGFLGETGRHHLWQRVLTVEHVTFHQVLKHTYTHTLTGTVIYRLIIHSNAGDNASMHRSMTDFQQQ